MVNGVFEGMVNGVFDGVFKRVVNRVLDGILDGMLRGILDGMWDGAGDGAIRWAAPSGQHHTHGRGQHGAQQAEAEEGCAHPGWLLGAQHHPVEGPAPVAWAGGPRGSRAGGLPVLLRGWSPQAMLGALCPWLKFKVAQGGPGANQLLPRAICQGWERPQMLGWGGGE